jgi:hypothetical protein
MQEQTEHVVQTQGEGREGAVEAEFMVGLQRRPEHDVDGDGLGDVRVRGDEELVIPDQSPVHGAEPPEDHEDGTEHVGEGGSPGHGGMMVATGCRVKRRAGLAEDPTLPAIEQDSTLVAVENRLVSALDDLLSQV